MTTKFDNTLKPLLPSEKLATQQGRFSASTLAWVNLVSFVLVVIVNVLSNFGVTGPYTNAGISAKYPSLLTPAGYTFAIWGVIWLFQGTGIIYSVTPFGSNKELYLNSLSFYLSSALLIEGSWTFPFTNDQIWVSVIFIVSSTVLFAVSWLKVVPAAHADPSPVYSSQRIFNYFVYSVPTSLNFSWLVVASVLNVIILFTKNGITTSESTSIAIVGGLTVVSIALTCWLRDPAFAIVDVWALYGILNNNRGGTHPNLVNALSVSVGVLATVVVGVIFWNYQLSKRTAQLESSANGY